MIFFFSLDLGNYLSGVIFYEETLYQKTASGKLFTELLREKGIISGIKVDKVKKITKHLLFLNKI